jgi:methylated-DNA-[protein]-cysteine S-methyltransferase
MIDWTQYQTPAGQLTVLATTNGSGPEVVAAGFCDASELYQRLADLERDEVAGLGSEVEPAELGPVHAATVAYLDGDVQALDRVPVSQPGTELQQRIWQSLRAIPAGETRSYTELAEAAGRPRAVRAAGTACGRNLIAPYVPCHRAQRQDGSLGGYYYGLDVKRWLLEHENLGR